MISMKHLILTLSLILGATSVSANDKPFAVGDVFFCQMEAFTQWKGTDRKLKNYKLEKFKFSIVDLNTVKFGRLGTFDDNEMKIDDFGYSLQWVTASDEFSKMRIERSNFTFAGVWFEDAALIAATCDRF